MSVRLLLALLVTGAVVVADQQPTFRATTNMVAVDVSVTRGRTPVDGLTAADFRVFDNGVEQRVESLTRGDLPLDITMVLDFSNSSRFDFPTFVSSASSLQRWLRPEDRWRWLGIFAEARELVPMQPALDAVAPLSRPGPVGISAIHDTVFLALVRPGEPERRHLVIVFTDGNDSWSMLDGRELVEVADAADAMLHVVSTASPPSGSAPESGDPRLVRQWRASQNALFDAAQRSGGSVHHLSDHGAAFGTILESVRASYVLRYAARGVDTLGWHSLKVELVTPGRYTVQARKGYERRHARVPDAVRPK